MFSSRLSPRDTWPGVALSVELCPWAWRIRWYRDDVEPFWIEATLGPLSLRAIGNRPMFRDPDARAGT